MRVRELRIGLANLLAMLRDSATAGDVLELERLSKVLQELDELTIGELCGFLEKKCAPKKRVRAKQPDHPSSDRVESYVAELKAKKHEQAAFDALVLRIQADKALKVPDIKAIAGRYQGSAGTYRNKAQAIAAIRNKWLADNRSRSRLQSIREIF